VRLHTTVESQSENAFGFTTEHLNEFKIQMEDDKFDPEIRNDGARAAYHVLNIVITVVPPTESNRNGQIISHAVQQTSSIQPTLELNRLRLKDPRQFLIDTVNGLGTTGGTDTVFRALIHDDSLSKPFSLSSLTPF
jgi:hypothetical protein